MNQKKRVTLSEAYRLWQSYQPKDNETACCSYPHFHGTDKYVAIPDHSVCLREQAWRLYITLRDGREYRILAH